MLAPTIITNTLAMILAISLAIKICTGFPAHWYYSNFKNIVLLLLFGWIFSLSFLIFMINYFLKQISIFNFIYWQFTIFLIFTLLDHEQPASLPLATNAVFLVLSNYFSTLTWNNRTKSSCLYIPNNPNSHSFFRRLGVGEMPQVSPQFNSKKKEAHQIKISLKFFMLICLKAFKKGVWQ